jgi:hypothetical protein
MYGQWLAVGRGGEEGVVVVVNGNDEDVIQMI